MKFALLLLLFSNVAMGANSSQKYVLHIDTQSISAKLIAALAPELKGHLPDRAVVTIADRFQSPRRPFCRSLSMVTGRVASLKNFDHMTSKQSYNDMNNTLEKLVAGMGAAVHPNPFRKYWLLTPAIRKRIIQLLYFDPAFAHATTEDFSDVQYYCFVLPDRWTNK